MVENENNYPEASPGGKLRPFTSPLERQPTVLSIAAVKRPRTCFPGTGFDAELQRLESDDPILRQMAMNNLIAMSKHGGSTERIIAMMLEKLKDSDRLFRGQAVEALSRAAKEVRQEVTTALITSLKDSDANVRIRAIKALRPACEGPSHPIVVAALSEMLCDENAFVVDATVDNLQYAIKHASFEVRHELLSSSNRGIRTAAVESFSDAILNGSDQALGFVIDMLQDKEFQVRMATIKVIGNFLTTRDTDAQRQLDLILKADPDKQLPPAKAEGPMIDRTLLALMSALEDHEPDIRSEVLRRLTCNTGTLNQKVFKTVLALLAEELEGTRNEAKTWISKVVLTTLTGQKEWAYNIVIDLLRNNTGLMQLSAASVISKVVANGNPKYLRDVVPILEAEHPLTRVAALWALVEAVRNVVPSIMWSSSGAPTVPRCLKDPDRRVQLAAIEVLAEAPEGTATASQPLLDVLMDNDRDAKCLSRNDLKQKLALCRIVQQHTASQISIGTGCLIGSKYMSLEVGYIGKTKRLDQEVRAAAIRAIRKMGVPDDIIRLGVKAMEVAIERHSLGYRYELPPNFWEEHNKDGTPKKAGK